MKMCKYCGGIVDKAAGPHERYCSKACWDAVEGFDKRLAMERKFGKVSLDALDPGLEPSDEGAGIAAMYARLDGTDTRSNPKMDLGEVMRKAADIHPRLPGALVLLGQGKTQEQSASAVGMKQGNLAQYIKRLRKAF